ncbi:MAG: LPS assembly lipoprotein LptE [Smithellaceae bacterium]|nr:LPS assembly lipoprotein LptE [Smithellaceae bacterium]
MTMVRVHTGRMLSILIALLFLGGCGYHFMPTGDNIDGQVRMIFIDNFQNKTAEAKLEDQLRNSFSDLFARTGRFKLASERSQAHAILTGSIENLTTTHLTTGAGGYAREERVTMTLDAILKRQDTGNALWSGKNLVGSAEYLVDRDLDLTQNRRKDALTRLNNDLAERAYLLMMSGF